jgi:hypothetical protein
MTMWRQFLFVVIAILMSACAQVPKEAVSLSDLVSKDLVAMRAAHTALVRQYFGSMRENVNAFVDYTYRPFIIEKTMEDLNLIVEIKAAAGGSHPEGLDPLDIMEIYVEEAMNQIQSFRVEMLAPINTQESQLLVDLDSSYGAMINASATVTAHLRSITKVHEAQQQALSHLGVDPKLQEKIAAQAAKFSGEVNDLLAKARAGDEQLEALPGKLEAITEKFK